MLCLHVFVADRHLDSYSIIIWMYSSFHNGGQVFDNDKKIIFFSFP